MIIKTIPLSHLTTIHLSGYSYLNIVESMEDLASVEQDYFIGGGSNIIIKDNFIKLFKLSEKFSYIRIENDMLIVGAATKMSKIMQFCIDNSISSLDFLYGVPLSIGGAVFMNAGAFQNSIKDKLIYAKVYLKGSGVKTLYCNEINFSYRKTSIKGIVTEAAFKYEKDDRQNLILKVKKNISTRVKNAHIHNTFGSVFKNPKDAYAGKLVEDAKLKGFIKNSAKISNRHANYIIGSKETEVYDILFLIDKMKNDVFKLFSVELEEEVKII